MTEVLIQLSNNKPACMDVLNPSLHACRNSKTSKMNTIVLSLSAVLFDDHCKFLTPEPTNVVGLGVHGMSKLNIHEDGLS